MDYSSIGGIAGLVSLVIVIADRVIIIINHKRVRSKCCGRATEISLDVESTTPPIRGRLLSVSENRDFKFNNGGLITHSADGRLEQYDYTKKTMIPYNEMKSNIKVG